MNSEEKYLSPRIVLIGYRASGKTTVARLLAERLGIEMIDTDELVEKKAGKTVAQIFADDGEQAFRYLETMELAYTAIRHDPLILATGGGLPMHKDNRDLLRCFHFFIVLLEARAETIMRRINGDERSAATRPALTALPPEDEIRTLLEERKNAYQTLADMKISTDERNPEEIVELILTEAARRSSEH